MRRITWALIVTLGLLCSSLRAEELQLKDGTKITGKLTGITGDSLQVKTAYGDILVPRDQVISINFPENEPKKKGDEKERTLRPPADESLDGTTYTNRSERFQIVVPQGWLLAPEMRNQSKDIAVALKSPDEIYFFLVTPEKFLGTLSTYKVLAETQYQAKFKDYEKISESEVQLDGKKGIRLVWHGKNIEAHDAPLKSVVFILPYENRMVRLSFLTLEPLFDEGLPIFEKIAQSYHTINQSSN